MKLQATIITTALLAFVPLIADAQSSPVSIPITDPDAPVTLSISRVHGSIEIQGRDIKEVQVEVIESETKRSGRVREDGLRRIPNMSVGMVAEERGNVVKIGFQPNASAPVKVYVPRRARISASTVNGGDLIVSGIDGELELSNVNGSIEFRDVSGTIIADTTNGRIRGNITRVDRDAPMSFQSLNGTIDITLPASTRANLYMKTNNGEILSDFDMTILPSVADVKRRSKNGVRRVEINRDVQATINGGGPAYRFTTHNGKIVVRKAK